LLQSEADGANTGPCLATIPAQIVDRRATLRYEDIPFTVVWPTPVAVGRDVTEPTLPARSLDLRHAFAVCQLPSWSLQGADVQKLVFHLSVCLRHAHLADTQAHLSLTPDLLREMNVLLGWHPEKGGQP
jgi:hypothetical protein